MSAPELATMKTYVRDYLANGFIRHSKSAAAAPVMFVKRPDGKLRLVVDYRGLNRVTIKNICPLPLIPEMLDRLHRAKIFTKINLRNAYHQVRVKEGDVLGPLPIVPSASLVSVPNPHLCAFRLYSSCAFS